MSTEISVKDLMDMAHAIQAGLDPLILELPRRLELIEDEAWTSLRAQSFDPETEPAPLWCIDHDQSLYRCEANDLTGCRVGVPDPDQTPARGDTTGEAALRDNNKRATFDKVCRELRSIGLAVGRLQELTAPVETRDGTVLAIATREARADNTRTADCECCTLVGANAPVKATGTVGGILEEEASLCQACIDFVRTRHRKPNTEESRWHKAKGKGWPPIRQTDRLRAALATGRLS